MAKNKYYRMKSKSWSPSSWRKFVASQQPDWDKQKMSPVIEELSSLPALVFSGETRNLMKELEGAHFGESLVLQVGNCAETFEDCNGKTIHNFLRILLQMSVLLEQMTKKKVVKIGRIGGQYAKPRSGTTEIIDGKEINTYRGDMINSIKSDSVSRTPDPKRMIESYFRSSATINLIRAFTQGGYLDIVNFDDWKKHPLTGDIDQRLNKIEIEELSSKNIYISHEGLILDYESCFARIDTTITKKYYSTSAHTLWIGERTRSSQGAHANFFSGVENPIGIKLSHNYDISDVSDLLDKLNPNNTIGKIMIIVRMGRENISTNLPQLIERIKKLGKNVIWMCDPMHGNTKSNGFQKFRHFDDILCELEEFIDICESQKVFFGGVHLEITSDDVTECLGGIDDIKEHDLEKNYQSKVDPRLNASQSLEIIIRMSQKLNQYE
jgi:3-deoxy-7-phosphoheptulonate synthase